MVLPLVPLVLGIGCGLLVILILCLYLKKYCGGNDVKLTSGSSTSQGDTADFASAASDSVVNIPHPQQTPQPPVRGGSVNGSAGNVDRDRPLPRIKSLAHSPYVFSYKQLVDATQNFSSDNWVGEGGFGHVYRGTFDGELIAVKRLKEGTRQGERQYKAEVEIISRIHHRNLVHLVGYCIEKAEEADQCLLVYNFLPNHTLQTHLHGEGIPPLDWRTRMKIATGVARGLAYLHDDCNPRIIHRDIKSSNILLDENFEAKVSDFGLAKLFPDAFSRVMTECVMGTHGYLAPEYAMSGQVTEKIDVFSFGVVLLELITGRKSMDDNRNTLVEWAKPIMREAEKEGKLDRLVDQRLRNVNGVKEMKGMKQMVACASACVDSDPSKRPRMAKIVSALIDVHSPIHLNEQSGDSCGSSSFYSATTSFQNNSVSGSSTILPADLRNVPEERELP